jgi:hypothetical protein
MLMGLSKPVAGLTMTPHTRFLIGSQTGDGVHARQRHRRHSLGETFCLDRVTAREIYTTLDWVGSEQACVENQFARRHLTTRSFGFADANGTLRA